MNAGGHPERVFLRPGRFCGARLLREGPKRDSSLRVHRSKKSFSLNFPRYEIGTRKIFLRMLTFVYANISARKTESDITSILVPFASSFCPRSRVNPPVGISGKSVPFRTGKM